MTNSKNVSNMAPDYKPKFGVKRYVPGMKYDAAMISGNAAQFALGTPALESITALSTAVITANSAANTAFALAYTADSPFGRSMNLQASGTIGAAGTYDLYGFDWLGQRMVERFVLGGLGSPIVYGKKAFYTVDKLVVAVAGSNAVTLSVGTGRRLGVPFKGDIEVAKENGAVVAVSKRTVILSAHYAAADSVAGASYFVRSPCAGYVSLMRGISDGGGSTTDPVITAKLATVAITGLTVTVDTSAAGNVVTGVPTTVGYSANNKVATGDLIEIVGAAAASAKGYTVELEITPTDFSVPDATDPATNVTGDPRGTYEPKATLDGAKEIIVYLAADATVNASGNGGLHGIQHFGG